MLIYHTVLLTPIGAVELTFHHDYLKRIQLFGEAKPSLRKLPSVLKPIVKRIEHYFEKPHSLLDLSYELTDITPFVQRVLEQMMLIPLGETMSYGELASKLKTSPRAVGNACQRNPLPLVIPCHRVVARSGIGGFSGDIQGKPIEVKQWLLAHEQKTC